MIKNTKEFTKEILLKSKLNLILGTVGSGKTELCTFLNNVCKQTNIKSINYEEYDSKIEDSRLESLCKNFDVIFISNSSLTIQNFNKVDDIRKELDFLKECTHKYNCIVFVTDTISKYATHLPEYIATDKSSKSVVYGKMFDNILTINKITTKETPFLLNWFKLLFGVKLPNAVIKFIKCRDYDKNNSFYLHFDKKIKQYFDIDKTNVLLKLFYDF